MEFVLSKKYGISTELCANLIQSFKSAYGSFETRDFNTLQTRSPQKAKQLEEYIAKRVPKPKENHTEAMFESLLNFSAMKSDVTPPERESTEVPKQQKPKLESMGEVAKEQKKPKKTLEKPQENPSKNTQNIFKEEVEEQKPEQSFKSKQNIFNEKEETKSAPKAKKTNIFKEEVETTRPQEKDEEEERQSTSSFARKKFDAAEEAKPAAAQIPNETPKATPVVEEPKKLITEEQPSPTPTQAAKEPMPPPVAETKAANLLDFFQNSRQKSLNTEEKSGLYNIYSDIIGGRIKLDAKTRYAIGLHNGQAQLFALSPTGNEVSVQGKSYSFNSAKALLENKAEAPIVINSVFSHMTVPSYQGKIFVFSF